MGTVEQFPGRLELDLSIDTKPLKDALEDLECAGYCLITWDADLKTAATFDQNTAIPWECFPEWVKDKIIRAMEV